MRIIALLICLIMCPSLLSAATYYVDKRCATNGNGSTSDCANGATGPINSFGSAVTTAKVPDGGGHTIYMAPDSSTEADCYDTGSSNHTSGEYVLYGNGNWVCGDTDLNTDTYKWNLSSWDHDDDPDTPPDTYYLTLADGSAPFGDGEAVSAYCMTAIVNGQWTDLGMNLIPIGYTLLGKYLNNSWEFGDFDELGYKTFYVRYGDGEDPTGKNPIRAVVANKGRGFRSLSGASWTINDLNVRGSHSFGFELRNGVFILNRVTTANVSGTSISIGAGCDGSIVMRSVLRHSHRGVSIDGDSDTTIINNTFVESHLMLRDNYNSAHTTVFKNNASYNLISGGIAKTYSASVLVESHNQFHLYDLTGHPSASIGGSNTNYWVTSDETDIPPSVVVREKGCPGDGCGVDPMFDSSIRPMAGSPLINAGTRD